MANDDSRKSAAEVNPAGAGPGSDRPRRFPNTDPIDDAVKIDRSERQLLTYGYTLQRGDNGFVTVYTPDGSRLWDTRSPNVLSAMVAVIATERFLQAKAKQKLSRGER